MILADTSVWIEYLRAKDPIYSRFRDFLTMGRIYSVPWIFGELLQGAKSDSDALRILEFWRNIPKPQTEELAEVWIEAGLMSQQKRLISRGVGLIDVAIIQAARAKNAVVWTLDKKLQKAIPAGHRFSH